MTVEKLFLIPLILGFMTLPFFLKAMWPQKTKKSLLLKMTCSTFFVFTGFLIAWGSQNKGTYAKLMLVGLVLGWLGDFFLHVKNTEVYFIFGLASFLLGHIFYISAFSHVSRKFYDEPSKSGRVLQITLLTLLLLGLTIFLKKAKLEMGSVAPAVIIYVVVIIIMSIKALGLGYLLLKQTDSGGGKNILAAAILIVGSLLFSILAASPRAIR